MAPVIMVAPVLVAEVVLMRTGCCCDCCRGWCYSSCNCLHLVMLGVVCLIVIVLPFHPLLVPTLPVSPGLLLVGYLVVAVEVSTSLSLSFLFASSCELMNFLVLRLRKKLAVVAPSFTADCVETLEDTFQ